MSAAALRVLVVTPDFPPAVGGIQTVLGRVVSGLQKIEARVVTLDHEHARDYDSTLGLQVRRIAPGPLGHRATVARLNVAAVLEARRFRPDVVLSGHIVAAPGAAAIRRLVRAPFAQYLHGHELAARPRLTAFAVRHAGACIAVSRFTRDLVVGAGAPPDRIHVIPNGVDVVDDAPASARDEAPTVLTVGRLHRRYKGHDVMLRALPLIAARVAGVRWVVVGDGPLRSELESVAATNGCGDRVRFAGQLSDKERDSWFGRAHVFAMPARLPDSGAGEGFGIVFLEANAHGLPVVAGGVGGALDAVVDGETGVLVDPTDHVAVADAIVGLLRDPERARRLGAAGAERARREFGWPSIAARVEELLRSIARQPRQPPLR